MDPSDEVLVHRVTQGDQNAFGVLHTRYVASLARHIQGIVRNDATAGDLCQETFLRAWDRIMQHTDGKAFRGWLFRIGTNLSLNHVRTVKRRREEPLEVPKRLDGDPQSVPEWMIDRATLQPDQGAERQETYALYRSLVTELPEEKRETFKMVYDAELEMK